MHPSPAYWTNVDSAYLSFIYGSAEVRIFLRGKIITLVNCGHIYSTKHSFTLYYRRVPVTWNQVPQTVKNSESLKSQKGS